MDKQKQIGLQNNLKFALLKTHIREIIYKTNFTWHLHEVSYQISHGLYINSRTHFNPLGPKLDSSRYTLALLVSGFI